MSGEGKFPVPEDEPFNRAIDVEMMGRSAVKEDVQDWMTMARESVLLEAVSSWRDASDEWFEGSFARLPETLRVNPMSPEREWVESWLKACSANEIPWFKGPGSAWEMPFDRGAAEGEVRVLLSALHETGRITRQEAVSMIPVIALDPQPGELVLDLCASPGSKTTQVSECLGDSGIVVANEVVSGRVNTLVSNVQRHASRAPIVVQHDGRHIPKVPECGFDRVLVDVPCTGSGTTRKNPEVWGKWSPSSGRSLHDLQFDLLRRALQVTRPGGRVVYATCSLDPVENEAVVARALSGGGVSILPGHSLLPGVPASSGMTEWPILGDDGKETDVLEVPESTLSPSDAALATSLTDCVRVWNDHVGGGGFFLAVLEKDDGGVSESKPGANAWTDDADDPEGYPRPVGQEWREHLEENWGGVPEGLWHRGKSLLWSTKEAESVWESDRSRKGGRIRVPGGRWRPLKVIHMGMIAARSRKGGLERVVSRATHRLRQEVEGPFLEVEGSVLDDVLMRRQPEPRDWRKGSRVLVDEGGTCLATWFGSKVTPMVNEQEMRVMRAVRGLPIVLEEEE